MIVVRADRSRRMDILRDQIWQFIGAVLGLLAIAVTVLIFRWQRSRKALTFEVVTFSPLLTVASDVKDKLQITFEGKPVTNLRLLVLRLYNSGNVPIPAMDYERRIELVFDEKAEIIDAAVIETAPDNIRATIDFKSDRVGVDPVLLNPKESMTLRILTTQDRQEFDIDARIIGISNIQKNLLIDISRPVYPQKENRIGWISVLLALSFLVLISLIRVWMDRQ